MKDATLVFIFNEDKVLLQKKVKGSFGEGKWNGPGGKLKFAESPEKCAVREVHEETGLHVSDLIKTGEIMFREEGGKWFIVHVFTTSNYKGDPVDKGEGKLEWFPKDNLPYDNMWQDDVHWFPMMIQGKRFIGQVSFSKGFKDMKDYSFQEVGDHEKKKI